MLACDLQDSQVIKSKLSLRRAEGGGALRGSAGLNRGEQWVVE